MKTIKFQPYELILNVQGKCEVSSKHQKGNDGLMLMAGRKNRLCHIREPLERLSVDDFYIVKEYKSVVKLYFMTTDSCGNDHKFRLFASSFRLSKLSQF